MDAAPALSESDPAERGLAVLQKRNLLRGALVLAPTPGGGRRYGHARQVGKPELAALWDGVGIEMNDFADVFARLGRFGFIEFSPLAATGLANADRQGFRTAFGLAANEWLTLVRIGSSSTPESLVVVVSEGSVQAHLPFFHSAAARAA